MKAWLEQIQNEPYRLFFPLGILLALGGVGHWLSYALGWMHHYSSFLHANIQVQLYLPCFIGGFLMTAIPRFSGTWSARSWELAVSLALLAGITGALFFGQWILSESLYALWLLFLVRFIVVRFLKRQVQYPPVEFIWIPSAVFLGLAGAVMMIMAQTGALSPGWMQTGRSMQEQGFTLALVLGIGGFLGPRLMGVYQLPPVNLHNFQSQIRKKIFFHVSCAVFLIVSFFLEGFDGNFKARVLRAVIVTGMFIWTRSLNAKIISGPSSFIRLLSAAFWMIAVGYWLLPFFPKLYTALLHFIFLGGFSLMSYCVSTMVILNHSGRGELLTKSLGLFWLIGFGVVIALGLRLLAPFFPEQYFMLLGVSAGAWIVVGIGWLIFSMPFILRIPSANDPVIDHQKIIKGTSNTC